MPFSFKPEISQTTPNGDAPLPVPTPAASFGGTAVSSLMAREGEHGKSLVQLVLMAVFGAAVLIAVGLFGYQYYLSSQIDAKKALLADYESRLATLPLEDMRKLSNRIKIINQLVKEHPSANVAFRIVEDSIENQVTYERFELRYNPQTKGYALQLGGVAPNYKSIAQQVDTLKRKPYTTYIQDIVVEGLQPNETGNIGFTLKMPILIAGLLPEGINLSDGAAARVASTSPIMGTSSSTMPVLPTTGTTTPVTGTSTGTTTSPRR